MRTNRLKLVTKLGQWSSSVMTTPLRGVGRRFKSALPHQFFAFLLGLYRIFYKKNEINVSIILSKKINSKEEKRKSNIRRDSTNRHCNSYFCNYIWIDIQFSRLVFYKAGRILPMVIFRKFDVFLRINTTR